MLTQIHVLCESPKRLLAWQYGLDHHEHKPTGLAAKAAARREIEAFMFMTGIWDKVRS
jgi:hypothetical protein